MAKCLAECFKVRFLGYTLHQVQTETGQWQGELHAEIELVDVSGTRLPLPNAKQSKTWTLGSPKAAPYLPVDFKNAGDIVVSLIGAWLAELDALYVN